MASTVDAVATRFARRVRDERARRAVAREDASRAVESRRRIIRSSVAGIAAGAVPFMLVLWDFGLWPMRRAIGSGIFSNFYDVQARALLDGDLDLPDRIFGIETFVVDGRSYMYFPPFPALLRLPIFLFTDELDSHLTALSMLLAWVVLAVMSAVLIWRVRALVRGDVPVSRLEAIAYGVLLASITGGSIVVYNASLPWVYHEAYAWSMALVVGTLACLLGVLREPKTSAIVLTGLFALATILTRGTGGWACAVAVVAAGVWLLTGRLNPDLRARGWWIIAAGVVPLVIGAAVNWMKFRHPFLISLEDQVWTEVNEHRQQALEANGGSLFGPQFVRTTMVNYFRPNGIRFVPYFPFVTLPPDPGEAVGGAFIDQSYRTGSAPALMPLLFLLTVWGFVVALRPRVSVGIRMIRVPLLGALAITFGVLAYGYLAHRYLAEFLPVFVIGGALGLTDLLRRLAPASRRIKYAALGGMTVLAAFGVVANVATGAATARQTGRGDALRDFIALQESLSGGRGTSFAGLVERSDTVPRDAPADTLLVLGDCDALYLASGDAYEPWIPVEVRSQEIEIRSVGEGTPGPVRLATFSGVGVRSLWLDVDEDREMRLRLVAGPFAVEGEWFTLPEGDSLTVTISADTRGDVLQVRTTNGYQEDIPLSEWNLDWISYPTTSFVNLDSPEVQEQAGVELRELDVPVPTLCRRLVESAS